MSEGTIVVVEDNPLNMKLFCDLLQAHGYNPIACKDGREVLELVLKEQPALVLMDIQLPEISGLDIIRQIKESEATRDVPVVAVSAFAMKSDEERIRKSGCDDYMSKPISVSTFLEKVRSYTQPDKVENP